MFNGSEPQRIKIYLIYTHTLVLGIPVRVQAALVSGSHTPAQHSICSRQAHPFVYNMLVQTTPKPSEYTGMCPQKPSECCTQPITPNSCVASLTVNL